MNPLIFQVSVFPFLTFGWFALATMLVPLIQRILVSLGIGFVVFTGYQLLFDQAKNYVEGALSGAPVHMLALLEIARVDDAANLILSAISVKLILKVANGATRTMRLKA